MCIGLYSSPTTKVKPLATKQDNSIAENVSHFTDVTQIAVEVNRFPVMIPVYHQSTVLTFTLVVTVFSVKSDPIRPLHM